MTIRSVRLESFGGVSALEVPLAPGLNVLLGDNESGKPTVFKAIAHTLLTPTSLDKRTLERELGPFFPRPSSNVVESSMTVDADGDHIIRRRWGADPEDEVSLPGGGSVRGAEAVDELIRRILPVSPATFRTIFLSDQAALGRTLELLGERPEVRDEAAHRLREVRLGAGGVSPEAFFRVLTSRLAALADKWDFESGKPERKSTAGRWQRGAGEIVRVFYEVEDLKERLLQLTRREDELELASAQVERLAAAQAEYAAFIEQHSEAYEELGSNRGLDAEIDSASGRLQALRDDNRAWPVVQKEKADLEKSLAGLNGEREKLDRLRELTEEWDLIERGEESLARISKLFEELDGATEKAESITPVDSSKIKDLLAIEKELPFAEARLSAGEIRARVIVESAASLTVSADGAEQESVPAAPETAVELHAARQLIVDGPGMRVEVEAGEESFGELLAARDRLVSERNSLQSVIGLASAAEAESQNTSHRMACAEVDRLEKLIGDQLKGNGVKSARAERDERAKKLADRKAAALAGFAETGVTPGPADASDAPKIPDPNDLRGRSETLFAELGRQQASLATVTRTITELQSRHGSQDELEDKLGAARATLTTLEDRRAKMRSVPEPFTSVEEFLLAYDKQRKGKDELANQFDDARLELATLVGGQPDETSEEVRAALDPAMTRLSRLVTEGETLKRVQAVATGVVLDMDATVFDPFLDAVARYSSRLTGNRYEPVSGDDPLRPVEYRSSAVDLPFDLLSQGTKDSLALAIRLALVDAAAGDEQATLVFDDPLVDMDPTRRAAAGALLAEVAGRHQVLILTCHPEHAALFSEANLIELS